jgi:hypothetical protein
VVPLPKRNTLLWPSHKINKQTKRRKKKRKKKNKKKKNKTKKKKKKRKKPKKELQAKSPFNRLSCRRRAFVTSSYGGPALNRAENLKRGGGTEKSIKKKQKKREKGKGKGKPDATPLTFKYS